jgi:hypothetical protein
VDISKIHFRVLEVDGIGSGLCPVSDFGISGVEPVITISSGLISQFSESVSKHEKILFYFHMHNTVFHLFIKSTKKSNVF